MHSISTGWELLENYRLGVEPLELPLEHPIEVLDVDDVDGAPDDQDPGDWLEGQERRREESVPVCPDLAALHDELVLLGQAPEPLGLLPRGEDHLCRPLLAWAGRGHDLAEQDATSWANADDGADQLVDGAARGEVLDPERGIVVGGVAELVGAVHGDALHVDELIRLGDCWGFRGVHDGNRTRGKFRCLLVILAREVRVKGMQVEADSLNGCRSHDGGSWHTAVSFQNMPVPKVNLSN